MWDTAATETLLVGTVLLPLQQFQCQSLHHSSLWGEYPACSQCSTMALREAGQELAAKHCCSPLEHTQQICVHEKTELERRY